MPASNIPWVRLNKDGSVDFEVDITDVADHTVKLLHVWLAATGDPAGNGAGLAMDVLNPGTTKVDFASDTYTIFGATGAGGPFGEGPATVSAIVVLVPKDPSAAPRIEVIQWSRTLKLVKGQKR
jgi:hypothetical protein